MANKTFSFELQQFDCRLPSVEAAAWGQEQGAARLVSKRSSQEYRVTYRIERLRDERGSSFTPMILSCEPAMPFSFVLPLLRLESRKYLCAHDEQAETLRSPNVGIICGGRANHCCGQSEKRMLMQDRNC